jgi:acetylglutamate kinase
MSTLTRVSDDNRFTELISKAQVLLEALPYIQNFRGSTFVVKYGGSFMDDPNPEVRARVAIDIVFLAAVGVNVVVVHGGGKAISRSMELAGLKPVFANGLRITDEATMAVVKQTLNTEVNADICRMIQDNRGKPLGLHGQTVLTCNKLERDEEGKKIDLGLVGEISEVKVKLIKKALSEQCTPIISPVAEGHDGKTYNVNADLVAARVASALRARRLVFMSDVPGLLADPSDPASLISSVKIGDVDDLKRRKVIDRGMLPKINGAIRALQEGVHRVHFIDGRMPHSLLLEIFTDKGVGTEIVHG